MTFTSRAEDKLSNIIRRDLEEYLNAQLDEYYDLLADCYDLSMKNDPALSLIETVEYEQFKS